MQLFVVAMVGSDKSTKLSTRIANLNEYFTFLLYSNVCRSLFEKDKMLLSFLICTTLLQQEGQLNVEELRFLAAGPLSINKCESENPSDWLAPRLWVEMVQASHMPTYLVIHTVPFYGQVVESNERHFLLSNWEHSHNHDLDLNKLYESVIFLILGQMFYTFQHCENLLGTCNRLCSQPQSMEAHLRQPASI